MAKNLPSERRSLPYILDLLILVHQSQFYLLYNGMENMFDIYRDKENDEYFYKMYETMSKASRQ